MKPGIHPDYRYVMFEDVDRRLVDHEVNDQV